MAEGLNRCQEGSHLHFKLGGIQYCEPKDGGGI